MSKLKELVPPQELCKLIPKGEFADSALVWMDSALHGIKVFINSNVVMDCLSEKYPAPTLEEIMQELFFISNGFDLACFWDGGWHVKTNEGEKFSGISPVCGALKLWLELKGIDVQNSAEIEQ